MCVLYFFLNVCIIDELVLFIIIIPWELDMKRFNKEVVRREDFCCCCGSLMAVLIFCLSLLSPLFVLIKIVLWIGGWIVAVEVWTVVVPAGDEEEEECGCTWIFGNCCGEFDICDESNNSVGNVSLRLSIMVAVAVFWFEICLAVVAALDDGDDVAAAEAAEDEDEDRLNQLRSIGSFLGGACGIGGEVTTDGIFWSAIDARPLVSGDTVCGLFVVCDLYGFDELVVDQLVISISTISEIKSYSMREKHCFLFKTKN